MFWVVEIHISHLVYCCTVKTHCKGIKSYLNPHTFVSHLATFGCINTRYFAKTERGRAVRFTAECSIILSVTVLDVNLLKLNSFDACAVKWSCYSLVTGSCAVVLCHSLHGWRIDLDGFGTWALYTYSLVTSHRPQYKYYTWWHHQYVCHFMERREKALQGFIFTWIVSILPLFKSVFIVFLCLAMECYLWISVLDSCIRQQI